MADQNLDTPSFGIVDTIAASSQEMVDAFLDSNSSSLSNPNDIKEIKDGEEEDNSTAGAGTKKTVKKQTAPSSKKSSTPESSEEEEEEDNTTKKTKQAGGVFNLDEIKDENEEDDNLDEEENAGKNKKKLSPKEALNKQLKDSGEEGVEEEENSEGNEEFNAFSAFSKELYNLGVFAKDGDEEPEIPSTPEQFLETFNTQVGRKAEVALDNFISRFGEDYQQAFQAIFVDGVSPKDYFQTYNTIESFSNLDLSSETNQEAVIRQTLKDMDYEEEDINTEVERLKNYGDLEEVAKKHHKVLVKKEAQKLQELTQRKAQEREQQIAIKRQFASNVSQVLQEKLKSKDFDGIPVNPKLANEVQDMLLAEKWKNSAGEPLTDFDVEILNLKRPENHATKVKVALLLKILKNDPTLSTIKKSAITKQTNQLFSEVTRNQPKAGTAKSSGSGNSHWGQL